jgi:hypothetical protein
MLLILKIPLVYVCWVVWWAIKAEPEVGAEGGSAGVEWKPWRRSTGPRPYRGGPHGGPVREAGRARRRERTGV